jgi:predicted dehydrogenase
LTQSKTELVLGLVGCGGMGLRHLFGLQALREVNYKPAENQVSLRLAAICDPNRENAFYLADQSEKLLGQRPLIFSDQAEMLGDCPEIEAVDITTGSDSHHTLVVEALEAGRHVLVEKPLAATVRGCNLALAAAEKSGKLLAVAENVRRDPQNRLARALIQDGAIGKPYLIIEFLAAGGSAIMLTPWRHQKESGGILLDIGVHSADLMLYFLGDITSISGQATLLEKVRQRSGEKIMVSESFYQKWLPELPEQIEATAEDLLVGHFQYANGTTGQWTIMQAAHGEKRNLRLVYGSEGVLELPPDRSGKPITLRRDDFLQPLSGPDLLKYTPSYRLDPLTAALFGEERPTSYQLSFEEIDQKLVAIELMDFAEAVIYRHAPEVDGYTGRKAIALVYGLIEAGLLRRALSLEEVEQDKYPVYQQEINHVLNLI